MVLIGLSIKSGFLTLDTARESFGRATVRRVVADHNKAEIRRNWHVELKNLQHGYENLVSNKHYDSQTLSGK